MAVVYPFQNGADIYAVKCWTRDIGDLRTHYRNIDAFLNSCGSQYFVSFAYVEKGIIARDQTQPVLRMRWVGGKTLPEFISANVSNGPLLLKLADRYLTMSQELHKMRVAHGDLQGSNIKVVGSGANINLKLIDYDTLIVPAFFGHTANPVALPSYQHPRRGMATRYSGKEDYFSELVIYLSLCAVAENPSLWARYPKADPGLKDDQRHDKDLLFDKDDFSGERPSQVLHELFNLSPLVKALTLILWNSTRQNSIDHLLPLEVAIEIAREPVDNVTVRTSQSPFNRLLETATAQGIDWLEEFAFVARTRPTKQVTHSANATGKHTSFEDLLAWNRSQAHVSMLPPPQIVVPPPMPPLVFTVRQGVWFFGVKYLLTVHQNTLSFVNLKSKDEYIFDPLKTRGALILLNPWWQPEDHVQFIATDNRPAAFSIPLFLYPILRRWWERVEPLIP
jgi:serine/threonine protein kinase